MGSATTLCRFWLIFSNRPRLQKQLTATPGVVRYHPVTTATILRSDVKMAGRLSCLFAIAILSGCGSRQDVSVALAHRLQWTTTYAHQLLQAGFDHSAISKDESDHALLREVTSLDEADRTLPATVEAYVRERSNGQADEPARRAILKMLDAIEEHYLAVVRTIEPRRIHETVQDALSETPVLVGELRERVISRLD